MGLAKRKENKNKDAKSNLFFLLFSIPQNRKLSQRRFVTYRYPGDRCRK